MLFPTCLHQGFAVREKIQKRPTRGSASVQFDHGMQDGKSLRTKQRSELISFNFLFNFNDILGASQFPRQHISKHWLPGFQMSAFGASPHNQNTNFSAKYPAVDRVQRQRITALTHVNAFCTDCCALSIYSAENPTNNQNASCPMSQKRRKRCLTTFLCKTYSQQLNTISDSLNKTLKVHLNTGWANHVKYDNREMRGLLFTCRADTAQACSTQASPQIGSSSAD